MASAGGMLHLPFRRTHPVCISEAIRHFILTKFDHVSKAYAGDLQTIDQLRMAAVQVTDPRGDNIQKLQVYAAQLVWLEGKLPEDVGVEFIWYPAIGYNTRIPTSTRLRFEYANVLFNLAALYSQLGAFTNRTTSEGLRIASNYFCLSAGVISYLKVDVISFLNSLVPEDMDEMSLESIERLLLAQAQECFWQKAVKDKLKNISIAKLAAMTSDYYAQAGDYGVKSDSITSEWIHHAIAKHHQYAAVAQYRAACDCLEKRKYGEEVARLKDSLKRVNEALQEVRYISKIISGDLNGIKIRVQEDLNRAEKDNDFIYLQTVPSYTELKDLERVNMVSQKVLKEVAQPIATLSESDELGQPLFKSLIPFSVHAAAGNYVSRKEHLVKTTIIDKLEHLNAELQEVVKSLNLPGALLSVEKPLGLPAQIQSCAEEIRNEGGLSRLKDMMQDITTLKENDKEVFEEGCTLLDVEAAEDEQARRRYGTERWTRLGAEEAAPKLYAQKQEIMNYLESAETSDQLVRIKFKDNEEAITLMSGSNQELEVFLFSNVEVAISPKTETELKTVRYCLNKVSQVTSRRKRKIEDFKTISENDNIVDVILEENARLELKNPHHTVKPTQYENLFDKRLTKYDRGKEIVQEEMEAQIDLTSQLREAHAAFTQAKKEEPSNRKREEALQSLEYGYAKYNEIINNLEVGRRFYNDLAKIVTRFLSDCRSHARKRNAELRRLESDISSMMSNLSLRRESAALQESQIDEDADTGPREQETEDISSRSAKVGIFKGPTLGMWTPEKGIKFADKKTSSEKMTAEKAKDTTWNPSKGMKFN